MTRVQLAVLCLAIAAILLVAMFFLPTGARSEEQSCTTVEQDRERVTARGIHWIGVARMPFSSTDAVFYEHNGVLVFSPILDGCVSPRVFQLYARYEETVGV